MKKTGFKTFVCSFVFTLSAIICVDKAFFYTPQSSEEDIQIPRKNIALFFQKSHPQTYSAPVASVKIEALETPDFENKELEVAQILPETTSETIVPDAEISAENEDIPLVVAETPPEDVKDVAPPTDAPLIYAGGEESRLEEKDDFEQVVLAGEPAIEEPEDAPSLQLAEAQEQKFENGFESVILEPTKQIIKIDNAKEYREKHLLAENDSSLSELLSVADSDVEENDNLSIPLQGKVSKEDSSNEPEPTQIASLGSEVTLTEAEDIAEEESSETKRQWQTMAEKHESDSPWVVARGSKFVKNKQVLKEDFSSEASQTKGDRLMSVKKTDKPKATKIAVQDNLLIPIPQELLDEDNLVPDLGDDEYKKAQQTEKPKEEPKKEVKKKETSILDSITSVFSKENREKAIKNLKAKSSKLLKNEDEEIHPQILPTEIRLSFQPNRAEISGQTLRWIQAFAKKAVDEEDVGLEIRIDGSKSFALQQKRLNMLYNILTANGVEYQKINTAFVDREPNSFVVRTVKIMNANAKQQEDDSWKKYYQKW